MRFIQFTNLDGSTVLAMKSAIIALWVDDSHVPGANMLLIRDGDGGTVIHLTYVEAQRIAAILATGE